MGDPKINQADSKWNAPDPHIDNLFDSRLDDEIEGTLYQKPSFISRVLSGISDFFTGLAEGIASAYSAVKRLFMGEDQAQQALRNIRQPVTAEGQIANEQPEPRRSAALENIISPPGDREVADVPGSAPLPPSSGNDIHDPSVREQPEGNAEARGVTQPLVAPVEYDDAQSFSLFVDDFKRAKKEGRDFGGVGRQQFEDAAKRHAQKLYDAEAKRLDALGDRQGDYALGTDEALAIEVASALLHKPLPHQKLLDLTGQASVPAYSAQDQECFDAWLEWRETKILPGGQAIDLESAARYANEFIAKNASNPQQSPDISRRFEQANELIRYRETDDTAMVVRVAKASVKEVLAATSPVPLPSFPSGVTSLEIQPINGGLQGHAIKAMIRGTTRYLNAIRVGEALKEMDEDRTAEFEGDKAHAILFATLWNAGKSDRVTFEKMQKWDFFGALDQLLDLDKIKNDFK